MFDVWLSLRLSMQGLQEVQVFEVNFGAGSITGRRNSSLHDSFTPLECEQRPLSFSLSLTLARLQTTGSFILYHHQIIHQSGSSNLDPQLAITLTLYDMASHRLCGWVCARHKTSPSPLCRLGLAVIFKWLWSNTVTTKRDISSRLYKIFQGFS